MMGIFGFGCAMLVRLLGSWEMLDMYFFDDDAFLLYVPVLIGTILYGLVWDFDLGYSKWKR
jgi:hypothetical protein